MSLSAHAHLFRDTKGETRAGPVRTITKQELEEASKLDSYYDGRWPYFEKVIEIVEREKPRYVLELGPYKMPIVKDSDIMDMKQNVENLTYLHDATQTPWPIEDKKYDMFIALQVWEHLEGKEREAFEQVMRVSKSAILSFPYMWNCPQEPSHHMIDARKIAEWTLNVSPKEVIEVGIRIIYFFKFDKNSEGAGLPQH